MICEETTLISDKRTFLTVLNCIKAKIGEDTYNSWFRDVVFGFKQEKGSCVVIYAATQFISTYINDIYSEDILYFWRKSDPTVRLIKVLPKQKIKKKHQDNDFADHSVYDLPNTEKDFVDEKGSSIVKSYQSVGDYTFSKISEQHTFENFNVSNSNITAYKSCKKIALSESIDSLKNPLFIFGPAGVGKTHLIHSIYNKTKELFPEKNFVYLTAESFMRRFITSIRENTVMKFKERIRNADIFAIDDIQFLFGKEKTEEEFFHTFSDLIENEKQVVFSGNKPPKMFEKINDRLRSRLNNGLIVEIIAPDVELRRKFLIKSLAMKNIILPEDAVMFLCKNITGSIREIGGAVKKIVMEKEVNSNVEFNLNYIKALLEPNINIGSKGITIEHIINVVCEHKGITKQQIKSKCRMKNILLSRQIVMYFAKVLTSLSYSDIGRAFGKDHTTALYSCKKISELSTSNIGFLEEISVIRHKIEQY